jgi:hypothetical protein
MGFFDRINDLLYPYTEPEKLDEVDEGFANGTLTRWDIPWDRPDEEKDDYLRGLLEERNKE